MSKPYTVIAILVAKLEKANKLRIELETVVELSCAETACMEYRLHRNITNPQQFIIYEQWESKKKHQEQFEKLYIKNLGSKLANLLAKPYEVFFCH